MLISVILLHQTNIKERSLNTKQKMKILRNLIEAGKRLTQM